MAFCRSANDAIKTSLYVYQRRAGVPVSGATFLDYQDAEPLPGTLFGGRFPIDIWPQPLIWAFESHNFKKLIRRKRGQPLFYCQFELDNPERQFQMFEAEHSLKLDKYLKKISAAVNYVNQTFSLFKRAAEVRPSQLLVKKQKSDAAGRLAYLNQFFWLRSWWRLCGGCRSTTAHG